MTFLLPSSSWLRKLSNRSQKTSKCGKNISDTLGYPSCATFLFLPHFDVICDLLLNRRTATRNLFVKGQLGKTVWEHEKPPKSYSTSNRRLRFSKLPVITEPSSCFVFHSTWEFQKFWKLHSKILAKEAKWTSLEVRTHPTFLETLISKHNFGPIKLPGLLKNGPQVLKPDQVLQSVYNKAIHKINHYIVDSKVYFVNTYPGWMAIYLVDSDVQCLINLALFAFFSA